MRVIQSCAIGSFLACAASPALAAAPCDPTTLLCSNAEVKQKLEGSDTLPIGIDTGWLPKCNPQTASGHCDEENIQIRTHVSIDPLPGTPIYQVDMTKGAVIQVEWPTPDNFVVTVVRDTKKQGQFRISHTLTPEFGIYLDTAIYTGEINIDATTLINLLPGAQFDYYANANTSFDPWAFETVSVQAAGTDLNQSKLFGVTFEQLGKLVGTGNFNDYIEGSFSFNATTDTTFQYRTTDVKLIGGQQSINSEDGVGLFPMQDADYLEFTIQTNGALSYVGAMELLPVVHVTSIAGFGINLSWPISVGLDFDYDSGEMPVSFPAALVHLPLPNVFVPSSFVDFGQVQTGSMEEKIVSIDNTGELGALLSFSSDNSQFAPSVASTQMGPGDSYDLKIRYKATKSGKQEATITVTSNDPDTPIQTFKVMGFGEGPDIPDPEGSGGSSGGSSDTPGHETGSDGGCGCRVAEPRPLSAHAGLAALVALLALRRRSRKAS